MFIQLLAETLGPIQRDESFSMTPDWIWASSPSLDIVFVPGGVGVNARREHAPWLGSFQEENASATYFTTVCTGNLVLGTAGLLPGVAKAIRSGICIRIGPIRKIRLFRSLF